LWEEHKNNATLPFVLWENSYYWLNNNDIMYNVCNSLHYNLHITAGGGCTFVCAMFQAIDAIWRSISNRCCWRVSVLHFIQWSLILGWKILKRFVNSDYSSCLVAAVLRSFLSKLGRNNNQANFEYIWLNGVLKVVLKLYLKVSNASSTSAPY